ncbi:hypothetical protein Tco_0677334 [Tanacetum coccineum]|uniref:Reverse transcriptase domain-containing protein n=1 Tax=Tanacetum coccineum TaxID=301880 RepID=A0ABQ4XD17_9ASTR
MDHEVKQLRRSRVPIVKVRWNSRRGPEFTWEREDQFRKKYPHLFTKTAPSYRVFIKGRKTKANRTKPSTKMKRAEKSKVRVKKSSGKSTPTKSKKKIQLEGPKLPIQKVVYHGGKLQGLKLQFY